MLQFKCRTSSEGESKFDTAFLEAWEKPLPRSDLVLLPNCIILYQVNVECFSGRGQEHFTSEQSKNEGLVRVSGVPAAVEGLLKERLILLAQMLPEHSPGIPLG